MGRLIKKTSGSMAKTRQQPQANGLFKVSKKKAKTTKQPVASLSMPDHFEKKIRREIKRQGLRAALEEGVRARKEAAAARRRRSRPVIGDLNPMAESLDDAIKEMEEEKKRPRKEGKRKQKGMLNEKRRRADFLKNVQVFQSVVQNKDFVKDPLGAVSIHVKNKLEAQEL